jgi:hypothetical protein
LEFHVLEGPLDGTLLAALIKQGEDFGGGLCKSIASNLGCAGWRFGGWSTPCLLQSFLVFFALIEML